MVTPCLLWPCPLEWTTPKGPRWTSFGWQHAHTDGLVRIILFCPSFDCTHRRPLLHDFEIPGPDTGTGKKLHGSNSCSQRFVCFFRHLSRVLPCRYASSECTHSLAVHHIPKPREVSPACDHRGEFYHCERQSTPFRRILYHFHLFLPPSPPGALQRGESRASGFH